MKTSIFYSTFIVFLLLLSFSQLSGQTSDTIYIDSISYLVVEKDQMGINITRERYLNGKLHGLSTTSLYDGKKETLLSLKNYSYGKREGLHSTYWANGKLKVEVAYGNGLRNGPTIDYWSNGVRSSIENYCKGQRCGEWRFYDKKGRLYLIETYHGGVYGGGFFYDKNHNIIAEVKADEKGELVEKVFYNEKGEVLRTLKKLSRQDSRILHRE